MEVPFDVFRCTVFGPHKKTPWARRLRDTLNFVQTHPQYGPRIGLIPADDNSFFLNSTAFAEFLGLKDRRSCNRDFQQHGFVLDSTCNVLDELKKHVQGVLPSSRCWVKRRFAFGSFNGNSSREEIARVSNHAREVRNHTGQTVSHIPERMVAIRSQVSEKASKLLDEIAFLTTFAPTDGNWLRDTYEQLFEQWS
jgi:hypothetical protein